jgi:hypothetical protein
MLKKNITEMFTSRQDVFDDACDREDTWEA